MPYHNTIINHRVAGRAVEDLDALCLSLNAKYPGTGLRLSFTGSCTKERDYRTWNILTDIRKPGTNERYQFGVKSCTPYLHILATTARNSLECWVAGLPGNKLVSESTEY